MFDLFDLNRNRFGKRFKLIVLVAFGSYLDFDLISTFLGFSPLAYSDNSLRVDLYEFSKRLGYACKLVGNLTLSFAYLNRLNSLLSLFDLAQLNCLGRCLNSNRILGFVNLKDLCN